MTPALAFFYGGLVRAKNALNTMMMSVASLGIVGLTWALLAYSLAFGRGTGVVGGLEFLGLENVGLEVKGSIPHLLFMAYQATFAIITAALISGAIVERMRFGPYLAFIALWTIVVYAPAAHWVWGGGWLGSLGVLDYAGGTVVHVNAASAALVAALVLVDTCPSPAATLVVWMLIELTRTGRATAVGLATAIVVGLVAITPAAGFVSPLGAIAIGAIAAPLSYVAILWRSRTALDDSLDVVAAHGVGGATGALLTGVFARPEWGGSAGLIAGNPRQVGVQLIGLAAVAAYSGLATLSLIKLVNAVARVRSSQRDEAVGLDITQHGEEAYTRGEGAVLVMPAITATATRSTDESMRMPLEVPA